MKKFAFVLVAAATFLVGCGSAIPDEGVDSNGHITRESCEQNGGTFNDTAGYRYDSCTYQ